MTRVLHIFNEYLPRSEVWAYHLISATTGVEHHIFAKYYSNHQDYSEVTKIHFLDENKLRLSYDATSKKDVIKKAVLWKQVRNIDDERTQLNELIKKESFSVLHFHFGTTAADYIDIIESVSCKTIVSFYGWDYTKAPQTHPKYKQLYQRVFTAANLFLVEGPAGGNRLYDLGCSKDRVRHLPLGIHAQISIQGKNKNANALQLIQIASFSEKKGQLYAVKALHRCITQHMDVHLTLVGNDRDPKYKSEVMKCIDELGLVEKVTIQPWIDFNQIGTFLSKFDAFIHPSCHAKDGDCEGGAPVIILQAQSYGLPIITTRHCDIPSQVQDGMTGFISPEKGVLSLFGSIQRMYTMSDKEYTTMSSEAIAWVNGNFDYDVLGKKLLDTYIDLVSK